MKELIMPINNLQPIEEPCWFGREELQTFVDMLKQEGPWPIVIAIPFENRVFLPDGHHRTILNALAGLESQAVRILETEEDRMKYGRGPILQKRTLDATKRVYSPIITELQERGIFSVNNYPIMKYRDEILRRAGIKQ